ncbi:MAG TPA: YggS family pyridoxal phosphate-dependent enzyme [Anaerolineales bacterium]|nr:YggS family pyridoxal phosphate-dependent enzyme [Anaerolineales bacterium]
MGAASVELQTTIRGRLDEVRQRIDEAARNVGRSPDSVRLVVVTKAQPLSVVQAAIAAGARILGENYAEEAVAKIEAVRQMAGVVHAVEWHMIGHVQSRKAKLVAPYFDLIHSLDSMKLAQRLDGLAAESERRISVLLECNVGGEIAKHGWDAADRTGWPRLADEMAAVSGLPHLRVMGLMTMPPLATTPEDSRPYFRLLQELRAYLLERVSETDWSELSMGTSSDFSVAVEEGATLVRVGEAIVGTRISRETP